MRSELVDVVLEADRDITLDMVRVATKVELMNPVRFEFPAASSLASMSREVKSVFLTNIPTEVNVWSGAKTADPFTNDASVATFVPTLLSAQGVPTSAMCSYTYSLGGGVCSLYGHPNSEAEATDVFSTDMTTKLVVCAKVGDEIMYYPVAIPGLTENAIAQVNEIIITGRGSSNPNEYIQDNSAVRFSVTLLPWSTDSQECILIRQ